MKAWSFQNHHHFQKKNPGSGISFFLKNEPWGTEESRAKRWRERKGKRALVWMALRMPLDLAVPEAPFCMGQLWGDFSHLQQHVTLLGMPGLFFMIMSILISGVKLSFHKTVVKEDNGFSCEHTSFHGRVKCLHSYLVPTIWRNKAVKSKILGKLQTTKNLLGSKRLFPIICLNWNDSGGQTDKTKAWKRLGVRIIIWWTYFPSCESSIRPKKYFSSVRKTVQALLALMLGGQLAVGGTVVNWMPHALSKGATTAQTHQRYNVGLQPQCCHIFYVFRWKLEIELFQMQNMSV